MPETFIRKFKKYHLDDFKEIMEALFSHFGKMENLKGKSILELGPGTKLNMFRFLTEESHAAVVQAAGKTIALKNKELQGRVADAYLIPFLKTQKAKSADCIYSRHVFEQNSFHPLLLLKHPAYRKAIKENTFKHPGAEFPASRENMQAVFKQAWRVLKPGGVIISQIAKRKSSVLTEEFLARLKPAAKRIERKELGRFSEIVTIVK